MLLAKEPDKAATDVVEGFKLINNGFMDVPTIITPVVLLKKGKYRSMVMEPKTVELIRGRMVLLLLFLSHQGLLYVFQCRLKRFRRSITRTILFTEASASPTLLLSEYPDRI